MNNKEINKKLESLVGSRFETIEALNEKLSILFDTKVKVEKYEKSESVKRELPTIDEQFLFSIINDKIDLGIDVDLFYIVDKAERFYITETSFEII